VDLSIDENNVNDEISLFLTMATVSQSDVLATNTMLPEKQIKTSALPVLDIGNYIFSDFESQRRRYLNNIVFISHENPEYVKNTFLRTVKYARWIRFYDPYLGMGIHPRYYYNYLQGIAYILNLWSIQGIFYSKENCKVEFFTESKFRGYGAHEKAEMAQKLLRKEFLEKIQARYPRAKFRVYITNTLKSRIHFHDRFLETPQGVLQVGIGFSLFNNNGSFKNTSMSWTRQSKIFAYLNELRHHDGWKVIT
jgi:hypothetical protein